MIINKHILKKKNQQKSANTNKEKATDMNTLLRYIEANGMKNDRKLKAYLRPSLTTFCRNLFERTEAKRRRIRAGDSFQFSAQYKLTAILRRNVHLTYPRTMSSKKSRKVLAAKRRSFVLTRVRQRKQTASCSGHRRRRRGCSFFLILNSTTLI